MVAAGLDNSQVAAHAAASLGRGAALPQVAQDVARNAVLGMFKKSAGTPSLSFKIQGNDIVYPGNFSMRKLLEQSAYVNIPGVRREELAYVKDALAALDALTSNPNARQAFIFSPDVGYGSGSIQILRRNADGTGSLEFIEASNNPNEFQMTLKAIFGQDVPKMQGGNGRQLYKAQVLEGGHEIDTEHVFQAVTDIIKSSPNKEYADAFMERITTAREASLKSDPRVAELIEEVAKLIVKVAEKCGDPQRAITQFLTAQKDIFVKQSTGFELSNFKLPASRDLIKSIEQNKAINTLLEARRFTPEAARFTPTSSQMPFVSAPKLENTRNERNKQDPVTVSPNALVDSRGKADELYQKLTLTAAYYRQSLLSALVTRPESAQAESVAKLVGSKIKEVRDQLQSYLIQPVVSLFALQPANAFKLRGAETILLGTAARNFEAPRELNIAFNFNRSEARIAVSTQHTSFKIGGRAHIRSELKTQARKEEAPNVKHVKVSAVREQAAVPLLARLKNEIKTRVLGKVQVLSAVLTELRKSLKAYVIKSAEKILRPVVAIQRAFQAIKQLTSKFKVMPEKFAIILASLKVVSQNVQRKLRSYIEQGIKMLSGISNSIKTASKEIIIRARLLLTPVRTQLQKAYSKVLRTVEAARRFLQIPIREKLKVFSSALLHAATKSSRYLKKLLVHKQLHEIKKQLVRLVRRLKEVSARSLKIFLLPAALQRGRFLKLLKQLRKGRFLPVAGRRNSDTFIRRLLYAPRRVFKQFFTDKNMRLGIRFFRGHGRRRSPLKLWRLRRARRLAKHRLSKLPVDLDIQLEDRNLPYTKARKRRKSLRFDIDEAQEPSDLL